MARFSILGLQLDQFACGHFRLKNPLQTLRQIGHEVSIQWAGNGNFSLDQCGDLHRFSHIICQRQVDTRILEVLEKVRKRTGCVLLYEVDDNLQQVHPTSHAHKVFNQQTDAVHAVERWIRACDGLIVTTPELAGEYSRLSRNVYVIPNHIDFHIRDWDTPVPRDERLAGKVVIGWAGGSTHAEDEEPLRGVLSKVLADYDDVVFALCSHPKLMQLFIQRQGIPKEKAVCLDPVPFADYAHIPGQFDIGLAPLRDTVFNRCKSPLKIMEYGARSIPYIASDIAPYRRFHKESGERGGHLCKTPREWSEALHLYVGSEIDRITDGQRLGKIVRENYSLEGNIRLWEDVLMKSQERGSIRTWERTERPGRNDACPCGSGSKYKRCCVPAFG